MGLMMPEMMVPGYVHAREPAGKERGRDGGGLRRRDRAVRRLSGFTLKSGLCAYVLLADGIAYVNITRVAT